MFLSQGNGEDGVAYLVNELALKQDISDSNPFVVRK